MEEEAVLPLPRPRQGEEPAEVQRLHEGVVLWPAVPGGGLGETRGILRGQAEEEENARSGLIVLFVD